MALMPGAVIRLIPRHNGGALRPKGRGVSFHVTASGAASMFGYFSSVGDCSHFHVAKDGTIEQYIDTDFYGAAQVDGNDMVLVETQGAAPGVNAETEPWTPQQIASNARIARWVHDTEGAPLVLMPDSRPGSRGVASHRLGIAPWRVAGGQVWSRVNGKVCPGSAKIAQLPQVVALAVANRATAAQPATQSTSEEYQPMKVIQAPGKGAALVGANYFRQLANEEQDYPAAIALWGQPVVGNAAQFDMWAAQATQGVSSTTGALTSLAAQVAGIKPADVDEDAIAALLAPKLNGSSKDEITAALREVLRAGVGS